MIKKLLTFLLLASPALGAYNYTTPLIVNHGQVGGLETNFPVLVQTSNVIFSTATSGGHMLTAYDLVFSTWSDCHYLLNWDTETVNNTGSNQMSTWVNIPSLSNTTDTVFYACYGNSAITTWQGGSKGSAWNSKYLAVLHFPSTTTLNASDSTSNSDNGTPVNSPTATTGLIGGAASFSGGSDKITTANTITNNSNFSLSFWIYWRDTSGVEIPYYVGNSGGDGYGPIISNDSCGAGNKLDVLIGGSTCGIFGATYVLPTNTWTYIVISYQGFWDEYANGTLVGATGFTGSGNTPSIPFSLATPLNGILDEVRFSNTVLSTDWITTEYNSQNSPSTFIIFDTEVNNGILTEPQKGLLIQGGKLNIRGGRVNIR